MHTFETGPRRIVVRANRETLALVVAASAVTFALAYSIHSRPEPAPMASITASQAEPKKDWTGHLAEVAPGPSMPAVEPLSSASLVLPKAQLALPAVASTPAKARSCESGSCTKVAAVPVPVRRKLADDEIFAEPPVVKRDKSLLSRLNPLNHLPDMSTIGRPFAYAGDTISGWVRRF